MNAHVLEFVTQPVPDTIKAIRSCAHAELFCNISLHGERTQSQFVIVLQFRPKFYLLFLRFGPISMSCQVT